MHYACELLVSCARVGHTRLMNYVLANYMHAAIAKYAGAAR